MAAASGADKMAIRWRQGLLRLWIVASAFWIASVWWFNIGYAPSARFILTASDGNKYEIDAPDEGILFGRGIPTRARERFTVRVGTDQQGF